MFHEADVLSQQDCGEIQAVVHDLDRMWIRRHPLVPFYSLGPASYMDAYIHEKYLDLSRTYNTVLRERFAGMYERVFEALGRMLDAEVRPVDEFSLPGFHIFLPDSAFELPNFASLHFDLQYGLLRWKNHESADFSNPLSFTLPIAIPCKGAALQIWDIHYNEVREISRSELFQLAPSREKRVISYVSGRILVHSGHYLHQMAPMVDLKPGDDRITLQGHAIFCDGKWQVYW